ncbi:MAG: hypothetical protein ACE5RM_02235, partial [Candidatus Nitrosomaritimum aestuariumsis]
SLSGKSNNNNNNHIFPFHDYILDSSYLLFFGFDLSLVLQHWQTKSSVSKNNAHNEHHFCPVLYLKLFDTPSGFCLSHNPRHVCAIS